MLSGIAIFCAWLLSLSERWRVLSPTHYKAYLYAPASAWQGTLAYLGFFLFFLAIAVVAFRRKDL